MVVGSSLHGLFSFVCLFVCLVVCLLVYRCKYTKLCRYLTSSFVSIISEFSPMFGQALAQWRAVPYYPNRFQKEILRCSLTLLKIDMDNYMLYSFNPISSILVIYYVKLYSTISIGDGLLNNCSEIILCVLINIVFQFRHILCK